MAERMRCWISQAQWLENVAEVRAEAERVAKAERRGRFDLPARLQLAHRAVWCLAVALGDPEVVARSCEASAALGRPVLLADGAGLPDRVVSATAALVAAAGSDIGELPWPDVPTQIGTDRLVGAQHVVRPKQMPEIAAERDAIPPEPQRRRRGKGAKTLAADLEAQQTPADPPEVLEPPATPAPIDPEPPAAPEPAAPPEGDGEWVGSAEAGSLCPHGRSQSAAWLFLKRHGGPDVLRIGPDGWRIHRERARQLLGARRPNRKLAQLSDAERQVHQRELRKRWASRQARHSPADAEPVPAGLDQLLAELRSEGEP